MSKRTIAKAETATAADAVAAVPTTRQLTPAERRDNFLRAGLRILLIAMVALAVLQCLNSILGILGQITTFAGYDFRVYYAAALALRANPHANIFDLHLLQQVALAHGATPPIVVYTYPPLLAILMLPLTLVSYQTALSIWTLVNFAAWLVCAGLLAHWFRRVCVYGITALRRQGGEEAGAGDAGAPHLGAIRVPRLFTLAIAVFLTLFYQPIEQSAMLGQVSLFMLLLFLLVPWLIERDRPYLAGGLLALTVWIKLFPAVLLVYFLLRGRWRVVGGAVVGMILLALVQIPIIGVDGVLATRHVLDNGTFQSAQFHNQALARVPLWIAAEFGGHLTTGLTLAGDGLVGVVAVLFVGALLRLRRQITPDDTQPVASAPNPAGANRELLGYAWALCAMVLISPITWEHYDAWLLPAMIVCLGLAIHTCATGVRDERGRLRREVYVLAVIIVAYVISMHNLPLGYDGTTTFEIGPYVSGHPLRPFFMLLRPLAALLAWLCAGLLLLRATPRRTETLPATSGTDGDPSLRRLAPSVQALMLVSLLAAVCVVQSVLIYVITTFASYQPQ